MREYGSNINLPSLDNLFSSEQERQDAKLEKIQILPLTELHPFRNHPFQVRDDDEMDKMVDSVKAYGVMTPAIVRPRQDGGYEIVAGHRRCHASQRAGVETMPCIVRDMDGGLSAAADARCESFVAGGAFDHSGMSTRSEICAAGPIGSASSVCSYWQNSPAHYANITNASFTSMGVACWFCSTAEGQYTYWTVTFN